jgi:hypothetical protein
VHQSDSVEEPRKSSGNGDAEERGCGRDTGKLHRVLPRKHPFNLGSLPVARKCSVFFF